MYAIELRTIGSPLQWTRLPDREPGVEQVPHRVGS